MREEDAAIPSPPNAELRLVLRSLPGKPGPALAQDLIDRNDRQVGRAIEMLETAAEALDQSVEDMIHRVSNDERLSDMLHQALQAAAASGLETKRRALGRALSEGVLAKDDAKIDPHELVIRALAHVEAPHVRLLSQMAYERGDKIYTKSRHLRELDRFHWGQVESLVLQMNGWGLVVEDRPDAVDLIKEAERTSGIVTRWHRESTWTLTDLGLELIVLLLAEQPDP